MDKRQINQKGFTLIELLVVIAVIALLLAIMVPALQSAKEMAAQIPCMANQRAISQAFYMYQEEYNGQMVSASSWRTPTEKRNEAKQQINAKGRDWVCAPVEETSPGVFADRRDNATTENEIEGIKQGTLWPYLDSIDSYNCPADKRDTRNGVGFRSYSMIGTIVDEYPPQISYDEHGIEKFTEIRSPGSKYITVEENDTEYGWNAGSWVINLSSNYWYDPVAGWHTKGMTLGFADGHADKIKWQEPETIEWLQNEPLKGGNISTKGIDHESSQDMEYMLRNAPRK